MADKKKKLSRVGFIFILAVVVAIDLLYGYNIFKWRDYPDFGFAFRTATGVHMVGVVREHGRRAGLQAGDRILKVNDRTFSDLKELRLLANRGLGEKNTYLLERDGRQLTVSITNVPIGLKTVLDVSGMPYMVGFAYALIGTLVFLMRPHARSSWIFFLFAANFGVYLSLYFRLGVMTPPWLAAVHPFAAAFTPAVFVHLALSFPQERRLLKEHPYIQLLPYVVSALLFSIRQASPATTGLARILMIINLAYTVGSVLFFLGSCLQLWLKSLSEIAKVRAKVILLGAAISASLPLFDIVSNTLFGVYIVPSFNYHLPFFVVFPLFVGYSIVKHDLFDFDAFIKRTYGYILTTGSIAGVYGIVVLVSNVAFGRFGVTQSPVFPLVFVLAVVFFFNPVRNRVQKWIDRVFYRLEYDYQETVQHISETLRSLLNLDQITKTIMNTATGTMFIDSGRLLLLDPKSQAYECLAAVGEREKSPMAAGARNGLMVPTGETDGEIKRDETKGMEQEVLAQERDERQALKALGPTLPNDDPLIQKIAERRKEVTIYDVEEDPFFESDRASCRKTFDQVEATLIVPLVYENRLTGFIALGQKKSGKFYRQEDINLLNTLANQGAVAIENAMLLGEVIEKERMEEELAIARDLQTTMLPATCPEVEGFKLAATSMPAREVGGDFFDFIEIGEHKVGLIIGDVTGKSVSGALVMSASRSVFRMLSEEQASVGEIMTRANRRLKKDIKSGMFVALLFGVLDTRDRTLTLCSAGQTQPIHLSSKTGEAMLVETQGDRFPLGILEVVDYQETLLQLEPGDTLILYTDGIVEAMSEQEELFGFDRLLAVIQELSSTEPSAILDEIMERVNAFVGRASQHDDLTVIVIGCSG